MIGFGNRKFRICTKIIGSSKFQLIGTYKSLGVFRRIDQILKYQILKENLGEKTLGYPGWVRILSHVIKIS